MGMSSSQARLLTLTARMHDIEYKAQRIEAQKLQMANESRRVYEQYLDALDAKKIQYKGINSDGSITFRDASLRALENGAIPDYEGECSYKPFLLKNGLTDEIYITPEFAAYYDIDPDNMEPLGTLDEYLRDNNVPEVPVMKPIYGEDYTKVLTATPVQNIKTQDSTPDTPAVQGTWNISQTVSNISAEDIITNTSFTPPSIIIEPDLDYAEKTVMTVRSSHPIEEMCSYEGTTLNINPASISSNLMILKTIATNIYPDEDYTVRQRERGDLRAWFYTNFGNDGNKANQFANILNTILSNSSSGDYVEENAKPAWEYLSQFINGESIDNFSMEEFARLADTEVADDITISNITYDESVAEDERYYDTYDNRFDTDTITDYDIITKIHCPYSQNDIKVLFAQELVNQGMFNSFNEAINCNWINNVDSLTNFQYAVLANLLANDGDLSGVIQEITGGQIDNSTFLECAPENWSSVPEENIYFTEDRCPVTTTQSINYDYSSNSIIKQIAYDLYQKYGTIPNEEQITELTSNIGTLTDAQWISLISHRSNESEWGAILEQINNNNYNLGAYTSSIPSGVTAHLGSRNVTLSEEGGSPAVPGQKEKWEVPSLQSIASNLLVAFRKKGYDVDNSMETIILQKLQAVYSNLGSLSQNGYMAVINEAICRFLSNSSNSNIVEDLYNYVQGTADAPIISLSSFGYPLGYEHYTMSSDTTARCEATYGQKVIGEEPTGEMTWDINSPEYKEYSKKYYVLKSMEGSKYKIIEDEELLNSSEFVANWLTLNEGYLLEFDPKTQEMVDTNVAVNTNLQEVSDEKDLKKAEAKYEADMKRIDMKDRRYDTQLAALDNERNAVKQEMETVKTVAKDNVDRTFRLFS